VDSQRKPLPIKEWKVLGQFFKASKPIRERLHHDTASWSARNMLRIHDDHGRT